jgi:hypothetical protein
MPVPRVIPEPQELRRMTSQGWTHQQIADHVFASTGQRVTRGAVSSAVSRAGLSSPARRYSETLPWRVKIEHSKHYAARMLRLLGRRNESVELNATDEARLNGWLDGLKREGLIVAYVPETDEGFHYIRPPRGWKDNGLPLVPREIKLEDIRAGKIS